MLQRAENPVALAGVEASRSFFAPCFTGDAPCSAGGSAERLWVAHVDDQTRCIHLASYPTADAEALPVGSIIRDALRLDSAGLVIAHHQSGGDLLPTPADRSSTQALSQAAEAVDVTLLDHLVFAGSSCSSFRRMGLL